MERQIHGGGCLLPVNYGQPLRVVKMLREHLVFLCVSLLKVTINTNDYKYNKPIYL